MIKFVRNLRILPARAARSWCSGVLIAGIATLAQAAGAFPQTSSTQRVAATTRAEFQPGVRINWGKKQVELDGRIILRQGQLELFACTGGAKAHESIVGIAARPLHVYQALGLIGLEPGAPGWWDEKSNIVHPPTGDPVDVQVRWTERGREQVSSACDWMENLATEKPLSHTHWIFCGAQRLADGQFSADLYGTVITVEDFDTA